MNQPPTFAADGAGPDERPVLLASPDTEAARALAETLRRARIGFVQAETPAQALSCLAESEFELVIAGSAHDSGQKSGLLGRLSELSEELPVLGLLERQQAPEQSGLGASAFDYIAQPSDAESTLDTIQRALRASRITQAHPPATPLPSLNEVVVRSAAMRSTMTLLERVAPSDATVMIRGERYRQGSRGSSSARAQRAGEGAVDQGALRGAARTNPGK